MRGHTPKQGESSQRRGSITGGHRVSLGSSIPRVQSRIAAGRAASSNQPAFDFLTGGELATRPSSRGEPFRQSHRAISGSQKENIPFFDKDTDNEKSHKELDELRAEIKTLRYTIDNHKQEEELSKLRQESELRDVRRKAEEDFKKMQAAEGEKSKATRQYDSLLKEVTEIRDGASNEKAALEKRLRDIEESKRLLEEEVEDVRSEKEEAMRTVERKVLELESKNETLQRTVEELQQDSDQRESLLQQVQQHLAEKESAFGDLEGEVIRLKAQTGDAETLEIIKRELSEQVTHIRKLESLNREQAGELKHLKRIHKAVEIVEEEKRTLQRKLDAVGGLENELGEARIQRQRLEDERLAWTAFLESQAGPDGQLEFDSPEALARALVAERLQTASLVERIGAVEAELSVKDSNFQALDEERSKVQEELEKLRSASGAATNSKAHLRLERQKSLAIKEAEYLRAQLKTYDTEDNTFSPETVDEAKLKRIQELEDMVEQYRGEVQTLNTELRSRETAPVPLSPAKRPRDDAEENEQLGHLLRRNRKLQDEFSALHTSYKLKQKELLVAKERLAAASQQTQTRVLSLRSNPTSDYEAIKRSTLDALRQENSDLMAQLRASNPNLEFVPLSSLHVAKQEIQAVEAKLASQKTSNDRLKKVWLTKSAEWKEQIGDLVGWNVVFVKDGEMRLQSTFYPGKEADENTILFNGANGTLKVSGGRESEFAGKIKTEMDFWVKERKCIPGFLAALTMQFYEEAQRDGMT